MSRRGLSLRRRGDRVGTRLGRHLALHCPRRASSPDALLLDHPEHLRSVPLLRVPQNRTPSQPQNRLGAPRRGLRLRYLFRLHHSLHLQLLRHAHRGHQRGPSLRPRLLRKVSHRKRLSPGRPPPHALLPAQPPRLLQKQQPPGDRRRRPPRPNPRPLRAHGRGQGAVGRGQRRKEERKGGLSRLRPTGVADARSGGVFHTRLRGVRRRAGDGVRGGGTHADGTAGAAVSGAHDGGNGGVSGMAERRDQRSVERTKIS
mmetsp:Transcript_16107/g.36247  ORF Transcript_16107/g.36247 Transcript_16107/m.36247 type:complete len:258 (-) Transcript_16107:359-1132(-)